METLYHQTNKLVLETQQLFSQLEGKQPNLNIQAVESEIETKIQNINSNCDRLDILCSKGLISQRQNAKMRVDQLKYDCRHLTAALNLWRQMNLNKQKEQAEREALLSRKFTTNDHVDILIDHSLQHNNSVRNAVYGVDNILEHGAGILENLRSQRYALKGAHKRLIDIGNALGLSNTTMRLIEQRAHTDGLILIGGIIFTCLIIILVIIYLS
ncbi:PREDICTED: Golgi SNAP receptor complex member 2 [Ceratosolen solmsi marchali]|uniref:Golgi SNAP receptor complex member 2 n=1 Tax=Ceratosolen solmsi marchali TaxID=326594 RepID=A0AAJ6YN68_9HYME|nr:PREDICTED: Golgi SNAP receptor complex member 2 [Ceratosolen solmsi marchali]